jgi:hypothetical protein
MTRLNTYLSVFLFSIAITACGGSDGDSNTAASSVAAAPAVASTSSAAAPASSSPASAAASAPAAAPAASAPASAPAPSPSPPAWSVASYDYWARPDVGYGTGSLRVNANGGFSVLGHSLKLSAPFGIDSCALDQGACVARHNAAVLSVCVHEGPDLVMVDSRAAWVSDLSRLRGKSFTAAWSCLPNTGKALVSAFGDLTIVDGDATYPLGAISGWVHSGEFMVRRIHTAQGDRLVLIERNFGNNFISAYVED